MSANEWKNEKYPALLIEHFVVNKGLVGMTPAADPAKLPEPEVPEPEAAQWVK